MSGMIYDAFISHASEDKSALVEPLAQELRKLGLNIWYDRFSLRAGDSLHESIEKGLASSEYGVVIFSSAFFAKRRPRAELNGLFAREVSGRKVILPVWHELTHSDMLTEFPIIADKVALKSSDGIRTVARALVEVIRPELLSVSQSSDAAVRAAERFSEAVATSYPGYKVRMTTGVPFPPQEPNERPSGVLASVYENGARMDIIITDPDQLKEPPKLRISFNESGLEKLQEGARTGKPQILQSDEFVFRDTQIPLVYPASFLGSRLELHPRVDVPDQDVRLEVDGPNGVVRINVMKMSVIRAGTEEVEYRLTHPSVSFTLTLVPSLVRNGAPADTQVTSSFHGHTFSQIDLSMKFLKALFTGNEIRIFDLASDSPFLHAGGINTELDLPEGLLDLIEMIAAIEKRFKVHVKWQGIPEETIEQIHTLYCLATGDELGTNMQLTAMCLNTPELVSTIEGWRTAPFSLFFESVELGRFGTLLGVTIPLSRWCVYTEQVEPVDVEASLTLTKALPRGSVVPIPVRGLTPTYVRFFAPSGTS